MQPISVPVNGSKMSDDTQLTREIGLPEKPLTPSDVGGCTCQRFDDPDPERIRRYHQEWEGITGYLNEWEMDCD